MILPDLTNILLFLAASLLMLVIPGPAVMFIVARSIEQGTRAGIASVLGIEAGTVVHIAAAAFGMSAILVSSATAFSAVKYAGAAYLMYMGIRQLLSKSAAGEQTGLAPLSSRKLFYQGMWVNVLNPKTAIFFFSFLPQFISTGKGGVASQILFLGAIFMVLAFLSDCLYAIIAGRMGNWLKKHPLYFRAQKYISGGTFLLLGCLALTMNHAKRR